MVIENSEKMSDTGKYIKIKLIEMNDSLSSRKQMLRFARFASRFVNMTETGIIGAITNAKYRQYIKKDSEAKYLTIIDMYEEYKKDKEYVMSYYCKLIDEYFKGQIK